VVSLNLKRPEYRRIASEVARNNQILEYAGLEEKLEERHNLTRNFSTQCLGKIVIG
jgi:hypothetical protein